MKILRFVAGADTSTRVRFVVVSVIAGLMNAGVLMVVNFAARTAYGSIASFYMFFVFLLAVITYSVAQRRAFAMVVAEVEATVHRTRVEFLGLIRRCQLLSIEEMGEARIIAAMTGEAQRLSQAMAQVSTGLQSVLVALITGAYIAYISRPAFVLWMLSVVVSTHLILRQWDISQRLLLAAGVSDGEFQDTTASLLHGFKEVKLNRRRADALYAELFAQADATRMIRTEAQEGMSRSYVFGQVLFFMLIGAMVFVLPALGNISKDTLAQATTAVLFVLGPVTMIIGSIPALATAEAAARVIVALEETLKKQIAAEATGENGEEAAPAGPFRSLEMAGVTFRYPRNGRDDGFVLGPVDFRLAAGETVFVTGGNGSGKSTFLRLLTGLYPPQSGEIRLDGKPVDPAHEQGLRECMAAVFADYFLFRKLYGVEAAPDEADALLTDMEIAGKTALRDGAFTTVQLSTGQRKRLALIAAVLEGKQLLVLDEWAADQDPSFRRKFYEVILPALKRRGMTIVAATHDDRWFHLADRWVRMVDGGIVEEKRLARRPRRLPTPGSG